MPVSVVVSMSNTMSDWQCRCDWHTSVLLIGRFLQSSRMPCHATLIGAFGARRRSLGRFLSAAFLHGRRSDINGVFTALSHLLKLSSFFISVLPQKIASCWASPHSFLLGLISLSAFHGWLCFLPSQVKSRGICPNIDANFQHQIDLHIFQWSFGLMHAWWEHQSAGWTPSRASLLVGWCMITAQQLFVTASMDEEFWIGTQAMLNGGMALLNRSIEASNPQFVARRFLAFCLCSMQQHQSTERHAMRRHAQHRVHGKRQRNANWNR